MSKNRRKKTDNVIQDKSDKIGENKNVFKINKQSFDGMPNNSNFGSQIASDKSYGLHFHLIGELLSQQPHNVAVLKVLIILLGRTVIVFHKKRKLVGSP